MPSKEFLLEQIARAKRFATAMNSKAHQEKFEKIAADYQSQLDAAETGAATAATETSSKAATSTKEAVVAGGAETSDAVAPQQPTSTDDQEPTID